jgi:hypothetical protein
MQIKKVTGKGYLFLWLFVFDEWDNTLMFFAFRILFFAG